MSDAAYDRIGVGYAGSRVADPRIAKQIHAALGDARTVLNVGAGTGNYEPADRCVIAVEPADTMIRQRPPNAAVTVSAVAEALPFRTHAFDAAMAISTIQHWTKPAAGLAELRRVAPRRVVYMSEPPTPGWMWLADDYFPDMYDLVVNRTTPPVDEVADQLEDATITTVLVPADMIDASAGAFWNRPERYLDPAAQAAMSTFSLLDPKAVSQGTARLRHDLATGNWDNRHGHLRLLPHLDLGYRLIISTTEQRTDPHP